MKKRRRHKTSQPSNSLPKSTSLEKRGKAIISASSSESPKVVQPKLKVGGSNSKAELEADKAAENVSKGKNSGVAAKKRSVGSTSSLSSSPGNKMDKSIKTSFESKFNTDFSDVKIHTDEASASMNEQIGAKAFTHGNHIYFNKNEYNPNSVKGEKLLAHELTHTIQQNGSSGLVQRSEVDGSAGGDLQDSESKIDQHVNEVLKEVRSQYNDLTSYDDRSKFVKDVYNKIGAMSSLLKYQSEIEVWVEKNLEKDVYWTIPYSKETKYANVQENFSFWKNFAVLGPTMLVAGVRIGSDKLGHFFHEGFDYFKDIKKVADSDEKYNPDQRNTWTGWNTMKDYYHHAESGKQGSGTTGVYSFADLAANYSGYSFYIDLLMNPNMNFSIRSYMGEHIKPENSESTDQYNSENTRAHWSEETNANMYRRNLARYVWKNVLRQNSWSAKNDDSSNIDVSFKPDYALNNVKLTLNYANESSQVSQEFSEKKIPVTLKQGNPFGKFSPEEMSKVNSKTDLIEGINISGVVTSKSGDSLQVTIDSMSEQKLELKVSNETKKEQKWILERTAKA